MDASPERTHRSDCPVTYYPNHPERCRCAIMAATVGEDRLPPSRQHTSPMMDRPAYELVRLIEAELDDADQLIDTPQRPNHITVWGVRMLLEAYGGKPHRWQWPHCFECGHQMPLHNYGPCDLCGCALTPDEVKAGARDEALDEAVVAALRWERDR